MGKDIFELNIDEINSDIFSESIDESFDEFDAYLRESTIKEIEEKGRQDISEAEVKEEVEKKKEDLSKKYKDHKEECKKCGKEPKTKKEFIEAAHENLTTGKGSYPESKIAIPGGDSETPKSKPYDLKSIPTSGSKEITVDTYNKAITAIKQMFKEGTEVIEFLESCNIVEKSTERKQQEFAESAIDDALLESYENGPIFEAVDRSDKKEVKKIVSSIRKSIKDNLRDQNVTFYHPKLIIRLLTGIIPVAQTNLLAGFQQIWTTRLWQVVGICHLESGNIKTLSKLLNDTYKDELGEYKFLFASAVPALYDAFKLKFGWKNTKGAYFILIDKKMPVELKEFQADVSDALKNTNSNTNNDNNS